ncbi:MAG: cell division protein FtsK [Rhodospirillales bacterium]|nr:cell division protein FtsK [Rhodospirillales bacterium]
MPASSARAMSRALPPSRSGRVSRFANLFPSSAEEFFRRRLVELAGLGQIALSVVLVAALATFHAGDPSWDTALPPRWAHHTNNLLGLPGSFFADLFIQTLGLAAYLFPAAIAAWGARLLRHRQRMQLWQRLVLLFPGLLFAAAALAPLKPFTSWPLTTATMGGSVGQSLLTLNANGITRLIGGGGIWLAWPLLTVLAVVLMSATFGVRFSDWRAAFAFVGRAFSWSTRWIGAFRRVDEDEAPRPERAKAPARRQEPEIGGKVVAFSPVKERKPPRITAGNRKAETGDPRQAALNLPEPTDYMLPPHDLLQAAPSESRSPELNEDFLQQNAEMLAGVLADFGVKGDIVNIRPGPVVTLYELEPAPGTKSSRVIGLADDLARSMSALAVRVAVVPGRNVIGIELPNQKRETVYMREILENDNYQAGPIKLPLILGKDIGGLPVIADLARMPHLLVAGTTGSGKSVAINTMILSLLYRLPPERCRFIMVDPKMLELSVYEGIPHLLAPVVTDPKKAVVALKWTVREMEDRYRAMSKLGVRNVEGFNQRLREARENGEMLTRKVQTGFDADTGKPVFEDQAFDLKELPYIVVVVDEFADLMLVAGKDIEGAIQRLAQMARAAGIHLIMATQRPSVDVITGTIKANFPTRISFQVTSKIDSRTILGESGAEQLLGQGDMLYMAAGGRVTRVHGPFVRDQEVEKVVAYLKTQGEPDYVDEVTEDDELLDDMALALGEEGGGSGDDLYDQAVALVAREGKASTSFVQRHLQIGYNRAARLIEKMEKEGVVSTANHVGKREVMVGHHGGD